MAMQPLTSRQHIAWKVLWWTFGTIVAILAIGFWLGIVPVADANEMTPAFIDRLATDLATMEGIFARHVDHQSGVIEPADIPPATEAAPVQNEHWTDVPAVPAGEPDVERTGKCGTQNDGTELVFMVRLWTEAKYAQYLPIANGVTGAVMATLLFVDGDNEAQAVYVSLPGKPVERMTGRELAQRWPHPCLMVKAVVGERA